MSGLFPEGGVTALAAENTIAAPGLVAGCDALWHSTARCQPRFDPAAANAMLSELINFVNCSGSLYDCSRLDNLCIAMNAWLAKINHVLFGEFIGPVTGPINGIPQALTTHQQVSFRIPNSFDKAINVFVQLTGHDAYTAPANTGSSQLEWVLFDGASGVGGQTLMKHAFVSTFGGFTIFDSQQANAALISIPPGGRTLSYIFRTTSPGGGQPGATISQIGAQVNWYGAYGQGVN